jgi:hypothetical protein
MFCSVWDLSTKIYSFVCVITKVHYLLFSGTNTKQIQLNEFIPLLESTLLPFTGINYKQIGSFPFFVQQCGDVTEVSVTGSGNGKVPANLL